MFSVSRSPACSPVPAWRLAKQDSNAKPADKKPVASGEEKAKDKSATSDKHVCKGTERVQGQGRL